LPSADLVVYNIGVLVTFSQGPLPGGAARDPGRAGIIRGAGIAVRNGRIIAVGSSESVRSGFTAERLVDAGGRLVTPGLVESHTHLVFAGSREDELEKKLLGYTYREILEAGGGIYRTVRETRARSAGELAALALPRLEALARHGVTVVEVKTGYGLLPEEEMKLLEAIHLLGEMAGPRLPLTIVPTLLAHVVPEEYAGRRDEYVRLFAEQLVPEAAGSPWRPVYVDVFCDKGAFTPEETMRILEAGLRHGLRARIHADELAYIGCSRLPGRLPIDSADHLEYLPPENASILARAGTVATLLPTSMLAVFADRKPPVEALRRAGAVLGVAGDYNPNNMNPSLQSAIDLAVYLLGLTPLEALAAATVNAAHSLRLEGHGRIVPGAHADLVIWDVDNYNKVGYEWGYNRALHVYAKGVRVGGECGG